MVGTTKKRTRKSSRKIVVATNENPDYFVQSAKLAKSLQKSGGAVDLPSDYTSRKLLPPQEDYTPPNLDIEYDQWDLELRNGFNVLLTGVGSKVAILESFARNFLSDSPVLIIYGHTPHEHGLMAIICETLLQISYTHAHMDLSYILQSVSTLPETFIVVHSVDGPLFRSSPESMYLLTHLAALPKIHLIASVDHIRAQLLWDSHSLERVQFVSHMVHTYSRYTMETKEVSISSKSFSQNKVNRIASVLESQTPLTKKVLWILAKLQLSGSGTVTRSMLLRKCTDLMTVSSQHGLMQQLHESLDHGLVKASPAQDSFKFPFTKDQVQSYVIARIELTEDSSSWFI